MTAQEILQHNDEIEEKIRELGTARLPYDIDLPPCGKKPSQLHIGIREGAVDLHADGHYISVQKEDAVALAKKILELYPEGE
jgi:hypothetical protein